MAIGDKVDWKAKAFEYSAERNKLAAENRELKAALKQVAEYEPSEAHLSLWVTHYDNLKAIAAEALK